MATSSVDVPPQPEEEAAPPGILDKARDLASAIGAAAAVAVAEHGHALGLKEPLRRATGAEDDDGGGTTMMEMNTHMDMGMDMDAMEGVVLEPLTAAETSRSSSDAPKSSTHESRRKAVEAEDVVPKAIAKTGQGPSSNHHGSTRPLHPPSSTAATATAKAAATPAHSHSRTHTLSPHIQTGRVSKIRHRPTHSAPASTSTRTLAAAVAAAIASSQSQKTTFTAGIATPPPTAMAETLPAEAAPMAADIAKLASMAAQHSSSAASSAASSASSPMRKSPNNTNINNNSNTTTTTTGARFSSKPSSSASANMTAAATAAAVEKDSPVLSFWGPEPVPLPSRFARIKRNLMRGHEAEIEASWTRLLKALRDEVDHIESLGAHLIPSMEFADLDDPTQTARFGRDLRRYGVGVLRRVMPKPDADDAVRETIDYLNSKSHTKAQKHDPACFDFFWTPAQVRARAHPSVLSAQRFMMGLWETTPDDRLVTRLPITYVDRLRVHGAGESKSHGLNVPPLEPPQSADDWISALESSAGIIAQVDNGSLERWEPDGYQHAGTYSQVFHGRWESHDPWECSSRVSATMDLYNGYGACTIFRMFQGVLALSTVEPGMVRLLPSPKLATAYYLLRPFFSTRRPPPETRSGPEWEAYLAPENWKLEKDPDSIIHGAVPGHAQRITEHWHPHLHLRDSMITLPTLQPGDYIFWHPDLPYYLSSNNYGLKTSSHDNEDVSMLVYVPAAPLTQTNALYLARQRKAFQRGHPGPDFDSTGRGAVLEDAETRPGEKEIADVGGPAALQAMGLAPWEVAATRAGTPPPNDRSKPKEDDAEMEAEAETKSLMSASSGSHAEAEVVKLANIILFPDRSMLGYSV